jgi:hypothetical protein
VVALSGALGRVERLVGVTFKYTADEHPERGFPAGPQVGYDGHISSAVTACVMCYFVLQSIFECTRTYSIAFHFTHFHTLLLLLLMVPIDGLGGRRCAACRS